MQKIQIVILAAGHGKRMQSETPKVLTPLHGKPLIMHLLESIKESGVCDNPVIVIGQKGDQVRAALGDGYTYAIQEEQLGTGHAVMSAEQLLKDKAENIIVLYGDQPYVSAETLKKLAETHLSSGANLSMMTTVVPDFSDWREGFTNFSRIIRGADGKIVRTVENKDATEAEKKILEVNPCYFCFKASWLWPHLHQIKNVNAQGEYYLTDLVEIACKEEMPIASIQIDPKEALGVNTKEQLELAHSIGKI